MQTVKRPTNQSAETEEIKVDEQQKLREELLKLIVRNENSRNTKPR